MEIEGWKVPRRNGVLEPNIAYRAVPQSILTKRKWRRARGRIIENNPSLSSLRKIKYSQSIAKEMINVFSNKRNI